MSRAEKKPSGRIVFGLISLLAAASLFAHLSLISKTHVQHGNDSPFAVSDFSPSTRTIEELNDRIRYLETKVDSYLAYGKDPFLSTKETAKCRGRIEIKKLACPDDTNCAVDNSLICLDDLPYDKDGKDKAKMKRDCVVYDYGIRETPEFGLAFSKQCDVVGFDPSPISVEWWKKERANIQREHPRYSFSPVGAGGIDGEVVLREYDWGHCSAV